MIRGVLKKVREFLQREASAAGPAARDATVHGAKEYNYPFTGEDSALVPSIEQCDIIFIRGENGR